MSNRKGLARPAPDLSRTPVEQVNALADLSGFQVLRKEFSSHKFDAAVTLSYGAISFNTACIRYYEHSNHIQILVDEKRSRIAIRSCDQYDHNAMQWARVQKTDGKRVPRPIRAPVACDRLFGVMGWDASNRYKILGTRKLFHDADIVLFLMDEPEIFITEHETSPDGKPIRRSSAFLPLHWKDSFGDFVEEHDRKQSIDMLNAHELFNTPDGTMYFVTPRLTETPADQTGQQRAQMRGASEIDG